MQGITKITHSRNKHLLLVCKFLKFESFECQNLVLSQINFTSLRRLWRLSQLCICIVGILRQSQHQSKQQGLHHSLWSFVITLSHLQL